MNAYGRHHTPFLFVLDFEGRFPIVLPLESVDPDEILFSIRDFGNCFAELPIKLPPLKLHKFPMPYEEYQKAFDRVQAEMRAGNTFLTNLTFATPISINRSLKEIFLQSRAPFRLYLKNRCVIFSPEPFVQIRNREIASFPMKGTLDAHLPQAEKRILEDEKELAEHTTIVDLIRNDLSSVAKKVKVKRFRYIENITTHHKDILQTSSEISGVLDKDWQARIGDIFARLLPAGSISGAPKRSTVRIIREAEKEPRGYYTGVFGYFDGQDSLESAVAIRYIEQTPEGLLYRSGGGITIYSEAKKEYNEMIEKVYVPIY